MLISPNGKTHGFRPSQNFGITQHIIHLLNSHVYVPISYLNIRSTKLAIIASERAIEIKNKQLEQEKILSADRERIKQINLIESKRLSDIRQAQVERDRLAQIERERLAQVERDRLAQVEQDRLDNIALNELTLHKKDTSSMITVHAKLDGKYLNSYWADGLIVSTPTGSTGYNLSCGGPIITPGCQVHIITPIAAHNLNVRPVVVPDHMPIDLTLESRDRTCLVSLDGVTKNIKQGEEIRVTKAEFLINVIKFEHTNFLDTIRNKMYWGVDNRN
jgi:NAD kinase